jgi:hypothetical protein
MLAERWNTGVDQAFLTLRQYARRHRLPLDEVATGVIDRSVDREETARRAGRATVVARGEKPAKRAPPG